MAGKDSIQPLGIEHTTYVKRFPPNASGLYDMSGNVQEWTCSAYESYTQKDHERCFLESVKKNRTIRGGSWYSYPEEIRSAHRDGNLPDYRSGNLGFRLYRSITE